MTEKHTDTTFITNEDGETLQKRFEASIKDTELFDVLVGYFFISGFHALHKTLEDTEKIRILVGIKADKKIYDEMENSRQQKLPQESDVVRNEKHTTTVIDEIEHSEDDLKTEEGMEKFLEWLKQGKLEIKAYPDENIHAKVYIMSFPKKDRDKGRVITGSSNLTKSGLVDNLEFNVELKDSADYNYAKNKFDELWEDAIDLKNAYMEAEKSSYLREDVTPYELYLKFLFEYFKDSLQQDDRPFNGKVPKGFIELEYQKQAVLDAKGILEKYGGVFLSDVVGLGKTYVSAMLAQQLDGRSLVIAPPALIDSKNPGSWRNIFLDFNINADCESIGKLDDILDKTESYENIFIDEAHRFRTETTASYEKLAQICRGKRVILVTATPLNNTPLDILNQIKLFQNPTKSSIPNLPNLDSFFKNLDKQLKKFDRKKNYEDYAATSSENARQIREQVLRYLMVRRTRREIEKHFAKDLHEQGLKFPKVENPTPLYYELDEEDDKAFDATIEMITQEFKYSRYKALLYYEGDEPLDELEKQSHHNIANFMKILLIKRLESSFDAFVKTINRFIEYHKLVISELDNGNFYIGKGNASKIFELLERDDDDEIAKLVENDKAVKYDAKDFRKELWIDLKNDLSILLELKELWSGKTAFTDTDPKFAKLVYALGNEIPEESKVVLFSESRETIEYLEESLKNTFPDKVIAYSGMSSSSIREEIINNFDANVSTDKQSNKYKILLTTEVLSEGVNLHRSNTVINYDIPWNPTRMMQRVGRINRINTEFNNIYSYNFFPTAQSNKAIGLEEAAKAKIEAFITLLGNDAQLLTEYEGVESHELFGRINSVSLIEGDKDGEISDQKYFQVIKEIRDNDQDLFDRIKRLPKKARTIRKGEKTELLTYFRKGKLQKFYICNNGESEEINFSDAATRLEADENVGRRKLDKGDFYNKLAKNKEAFFLSTTQETDSNIALGGQSNAGRVHRILKSLDRKPLTEEQENYLHNVAEKISEGTIPAQPINKVAKKIKEEKLESSDSIKIIGILKNIIRPTFLKDHITENAANTAGPREVILSEYFTND